MLLPQPRSDLVGVLATQVLWESLMSVLHNNIHLHQRLTVCTLQYN